MSVTAAPSDTPTHLHPSAPQTAAPASHVDSTTEPDGRVQAGPDTRSPATETLPPADPSAKTPPAEAPKDFERISIGKRSLVVFSLCMAVFLAALDVTIITTALPTISEYFQSSSGYTWIGAAFLLGNAASVSTWGKVSDIFGRKPVLLLANLIFLVGSLVCGLANSIGMLIAGRSVQGIGAGGLVSLVNIVIGDLFSLRNRGAYYGIIGGVWAIASAIGPIIGGAFTQKASWRWCFYINLPLDGLAFVIILVFLDLNTPKTGLVEGLKAIDWAGSILVVGATLMFLFGLEFGGITHPWSSPIVICLVVFGLVTFAVFMVWEWKFAKYPIMPTSIFSTVSKAAILVVVSSHGMVFIASSYYLPLYFQASLGASPIRSGVLLLPTCVALSVSSLITGIWIRKTGRFLDCIYVGFFFMTLGTGLFINLKADSSLAKIVIYQIIGGLGIGPLFQSPLIALQSHINPRDMATATATFGFVRQLSTSISVVIGGVIYQNRIQARSATVSAAVGQQVGMEITGAGAGANTKLVQSLPEPGRSVAEAVFADSLSTMWILYLILSFLGLSVAFLIRKKALTADFAEAKTGLDAEKARAAERKMDKEEKSSKKKAKKAPHTNPVTDDTDLEKRI